MTCRSNQAGFTLAELIVLIFFVGLFVSYAFIEYAYARSCANDATATAELHRAMVHLEDYNQRKGEYPTGVGEFRAGSIFRLEPGMNWKAFNNRRKGPEKKASVFMAIAHAEADNRWVADYPANGTTVVPK